MLRLVESTRMRVVLFKVEFCQFVRAAQCRETAVSVVAVPALKAKLVQSQTLGHSTESLVYQLSHKQGLQVETIDIYKLDTRRTGHTPDNPNLVL